MANSHSSPKWQIIDLVRSFSICIVVWTHAGWLCKTINNPWLDWLWKKMLENGPYGVGIFFTVSGFLITNVIANYSKGLYQPDFKKFYIQRAGRILPLYLLDIVVGSLIWLLVDRNDWRWFNSLNQGIGYDPWFWLTLLTFTFNWLHFIHARLILYGGQWLVLWSLSVEEQFYFCFPFLLKKTGGREKLIRLLIGIVVLAFSWRLAAHLLKPKSVVFQNFNSFAVFDQIAMGVLLHLTLERYGESIARLKKFNSVICLMGFAMVVYVLLGTSYESTVDRIYSPFVLGSGVFIFLLGGLHLPLFESKILKPFSLPGKYCYGIYLIHPLVIRLFLYGFLSRAGEYTTLLALIILCTFIAGISYHFFEMPMNRLIREKTA